MPNFVKQCVVLILSQTLAMYILNHEQREGQLQIKKYSKIITLTRIVIFMGLAILCFYSYSDYWSRQQFRAVIETDATRAPYDYMADVYDISVIALPFLIWLFSFKKPIVAFTIILIPCALLSCWSSFFLVSMVMNGNYTRLTTAKIPLITVWWLMLLFLIIGIRAARKRNKLAIQITP